MALLPSGNVTFRFIDIQGSTKLALENPETWEVLRARHNDILQLEPTVSDAQLVLESMVVDR